MAILLTVLEIVAPVFLLASIGYVWIKMGLEYRAQFVTQLSVTLSLPCLIFVSLMQTDIDPSALANLSLAAIAAYGAVTVVMIGVVRLCRLDRRSYLAPMIFGNTGNVGLPLALFAFGDIGLGYAVVVFAVMVIWSFTYGVWLVAGGGSLGKVVREPLVAATLLGALFQWQGWETPDFLTNSLKLVGQMTIPMMLITLGVAVARLKPGNLWLAIILSALKLVICVGLSWYIGRWFNLEPISFAVLVIQVSTPIAVTSYMLAEKYGADSDAVAGLVVTSTLMSVAALPVLLALLL
ncbi:AEC family transporter [Pseudoruegeria sp. SK021]|uniref:AEC family transporter n=1 Tax=Pseudoruegeria sp. SK021 TaxID=1933035 RepID=UPI000A21AA2D|nr:AEC family transporter [Pseudoruegeria sp. SK021]OSP55090.1 transporter [Pseudoruegeria sp. SK021]